MSWIACTRMYDVTPGVRAHWHALMRRAASDAGVTLECIDHAAPAPLTDLWARSDLAAAFMCGFPLATRYLNFRVLVAPVTGIAVDNRPSYRSVWLVRADSAFDSLESTFGHRIGWTVEHSHSGFNAPRHALLPYRTPAQPRLYRQSIGPLGHPRAAIAALDADHVDVVAIDAYWWWLLQRHEPAEAMRARMIGATPDEPMPPLVCSPTFADNDAVRLSDSLLRLPGDPLARASLDALGILTFAAVRRDDYQRLVELDREARAACYAQPM